MTKMDVLGEVIEILIKNAMENDLSTQKLMPKVKNKTGGELNNGVYTSTCCM